LRALQLKQWKQAKTIYRKLRARGASHDLAAQVAAHHRRWWRNANTMAKIALPNSYFDKLGVPRLAA